MSCDDILRGRVQTVLGTVSPEELGVTLPHEQLLLDLTPLLLPPTYGCCDLTNIEMVMQNLGKIRQYPYSVKTNLILDSEEELIEELKLYKKAGGDTMCDVSPSIGVRIKPASLPQLSRESGVKIVCGTGYYVDIFLSDEVKMMSEDEMADNMVKEIRQGIGDTGVRCGVIGEIGCSWPLTPTEHKTLRAAAKAQRETGAPLMIHPGANEKAPFEILDVLEGAEADISHTVMSHLDFIFFDNDVLLKLAKRGCYLEYDQFGTECSHCQLNAIETLPSDAQLIQNVKLLVENGYSHRVLISQDIHTKHRQVRYGGHGYGHILENIVPKMEDRGIPGDVVRSIITDNPRKWLTFV